jgi:hypothetical protein
MLATSLIAGPDITVTRDNEKYGSRVVKPMMIRSEPSNPDTFILLDSLRLQYIKNGRRRLTLLSLLA